MPSRDRPGGGFDHEGPEAALAALTRRHPDLMRPVERIAAPTLIATGDHDPNLAST